MPTDSVARIGEKSPKGLLFYWLIWKWEKVPPKAPKGLFLLKIFRLFKNIYISKNFLDLLMPQNQLSILGGEKRALFGKLLALLSNNFSGNTAQSNQYM